MESLYVNNSFNISVLNENHPHITWEEGIKLQETEQLEFTIESSETISITQTIQDLIKQVYDARDFYLTGLQYNIEDQTGKIVFSPFQNIDPERSIKSFLRTVQPETYTFAQTIAQENIVYSTGSLYAIYLADYDISELSFKPGHGLYISVKNSTHQYTTQSHGQPQTHMM